MGYRGNIASPRALGALVCLALAPGCGLFKSKDAVDPNTLKASTLISQTFEEETNMARSSGPVTHLRLMKLFENFYDYGAVEYSAHPSIQANAPLGALDKPINAIAQLTLREKTSYYCNHFNWYGGAHPGLKLFQTTDLLMTGESLPTDEAERLAFAGARNGWLLPYTASSPEVQELAKLYRKTIAEAGTTPDQAKHALCLAILGAPQFWLGNQTPEDGVRRLALEMGRRLPTYKEYDDFIQKRMNLRQYAKKIQSEAGYKTAIKSWHEDWLGNFYNPYKAFDLRPATMWEGNYLSTQSADLIRYNPNKYTPAQLSGPSIIHAPKTLQAALDDYVALSGTTPARAAIAAGMGNYLRIDEWEYATRAAFPQRCDVSKDQAFDPRSAAIHYEQRNPLLADNGFPEAQQWETIGSWQRRKDGNGNWTTEWTMVAGRVTIAVNGGVRTYRTTSLRDLTDALSVDSVASAEPFQYRPVNPGTANEYRSALIGTRLETFRTPDRRIRRMGLDGLEQDGTSVVQLPYTGAPVRVCNSMDHYFATCALRPNSRNLSDYFSSNIAERTPATNKYDVRPYSIVNRWAILQPAILDAMKCGVPNRAAMRNLKAASFTRPWDDPYEESAWPFGYNRNFAQSANAIQATLNPVADYLSVIVYGYFTHDTYQESATNIETDAFLAYKKDIEQEPMRLVEELLDGGKDYRLLLTSNSTWGSEYYERLLRDQAYFLPGAPQGFTPSYDPVKAKEIRRITPSTFPAIPIQAVESVLRTHSMDDANRMADLVQIGEIRPTLRSGILTMPAFLGQRMPAADGGALGLRTISARVFTRLLCGNPSSIQLTSSQQSIHRPYIPNVEAAAKDHLDPNKGCYSCHINMDPLASVFSANFATNVYSKAMGELRYLDGGPYYQSSLYGIRGGGPPSKGAFMGQEVTGIAQMAQIMADSDEFNRCATQKAMEHIYGRSFVFADAKDFKKVVDRFKQHHDYNEMILDLVSMPSYEKGN